MIMPHETFNSAKAELLALMHDHCKESVDVVKDAQSLEELMLILISFRGDTIHDAFPNIEWVRKWCAPYIESINKYGIYIDQDVLTNNLQHTEVYLYGNCRFTAEICETKLYYFAVFGRSHLHLSLKDYAMAMVVAQPMTKVTYDKEKNAKLKIIRK